MARVQFIQWFVIKGMISKTEFFTRTPSNERPHTTNLLKRVCIDQDSSTKHRGPHVQNKTCT